MLDKFRWKRIRQDVRYYCERCFVRRRAKIQPRITATLYPLHVLPRPWHTISLECLIQFPVINSFDSVLIVVDILSQMVKFLPCTWTDISEETASLILHGVYILNGPRMMVIDRDPKV
jgi:hypothetical protein